MRECGLQRWAHSVVCHPLLVLLTWETTRKCVILGAVWPADCPRGGQQKDMCMSEEPKWCDGEVLWAGTPLNEAAPSIQLPPFTSSLTGFRPCHPLQPQDRRSSSPVPGSR